MRAISATIGLLVLVVLLAGCSGDKPSVGAGSSVTDFITPGTWDVRGTPDRMFAWAHNPGAAPLEVDWSLTLADGAPLPSGWQVSFSPASSTLAANGTKVDSARGPTYPDWASTLITLSVPVNETAGARQVELHAGPLVTSATITVAANRMAVSGPGSKVTVHYDGRFSDGKSFDDGEFPTTLGSGQTVAGFDNGLMGLAVGETQTLVIPPAFGYGYDNPPGNYARFNGQTLHFTVTMKSIA
jgi:hypothetical protein